jgi:hypothetical protein
MCQITLGTTTTVFLINPTKFVSKVVKFFTIQGLGYFVSKVVKFINALGALGLLCTTKDHKLT